MTPKEKAEQLVGSCRVVLMLSDTDAGHEILCTTLAKQFALIAVNEVLEDRAEVDGMRIINDPYWIKVKQEIEKL